MTLNFVNYVPYILKSTHQSFASPHWQPFSLYTKTHARTRAHTQRKYVLKIYRHEFLHQVIFSKPCYGTTLCCHYIKISCVLFMPLFIIYTQISSTNFICLLFYKSASMQYFQGPACTNRQKLQQVMDKNYFSLQDTHVLLSCS